MIHAQMHPSYGMCLYGRIVLKWHLPFVNTYHNIIQLYDCVSFDISTFDMSLCYLTFMGRNVENKKKLMSV